MAKGNALAKVPTVGKVGIGLGFVLLVGVAYLMVWYSDVSSAIQSAQTQEQSLLEKLKDARKIEFAYQQDLAELNQREQRQRDLNKALPETAASASFLSAVQGVANVAGVTLTSWEPQAEAVEQFYAKVPMKLGLSGRFHQIAKFFYGVGQLDRIINIEDIDIKEPKITGDADEVEVKAVCMATAFRGIPAAAAQPAEGSAQQ